MNPFNLHSFNVYNSNHFKINQYLIESILNNFLNKITVWKFHLAILSQIPLPCIHKHTIQSTNTYTFSFAMFCTIFSMHTVKQVLKIKTVKKPIFTKHSVVLWLACTMRHICGLTIQKCCIHNNMNNSRELGAGKMFIQHIKE